MRGGETAEELRREVKDGGRLVAAGDGWWLSPCSQGMWLIEVGGARLPERGSQA